MPPSRLAAVIGLALHDMFRPDYRGSPGDALGLAIVMLFTVMLIAGLLLVVLLRMLFVRAHRRWWQPPLPGPPPDC